MIDRIKGSDGIDLVASSCEHIAVEIGTKVRLKWPNRKVKVEVTEDGENGAVVEWLL